MLGKKSKIVLDIVLFVVWPLALIAWLALTIHDGHEAGLRCGDRGYASPVNTYFVPTCDLSLDIAGQNCVFKSPESPYYSIHLRPKLFIGKLHDWTEIGPSFVLHGINTTSQAVLWLHNGAPWCFSPANGD